MDYLLRSIDDTFWRRVKVISAQEGITVRSLIIRCLKIYINHTPLLNDEQLDREIDCTEAKVMAKDALDIIKS
jgi:hypothetical protein